MCRIESNLREIRLHSVVIEVRVSVGKGFRKSHEASLEALTRGDLLLDPSVQLICPL
jgi:hypothetical protein